MTDHLTQFTLPSPMGTLTVVMNGDALCALEFEGHEDRGARLLAKGYDDAEIETVEPDPKVKAALEAYFDGDITAVDALPTAARGTAFERSVWDALRKIPAGRTASYGEIAAKLGRPGASRAVGRANGLNPIAIVVPCHRVIGADGTLTGYASGLQRKEWLLRHEGALLA